MSARTGPRPRRVCAPACLALALALGQGMACAQGTDNAAAYTVTGDGIAQSLSGQPGDPAQGRRIVASRQTGLCLLCHSGPFPEETSQGNLAPDLSGTGSRWSTAQLRLKLVDSRRLNPDTIMPAYHRTDGLINVGPAWRDKTILSAQQIEDVVAFLATLRD